MEEKSVDWDQIREELSWYQFKENGGRRPLSKADRNRVMSALRELKKEYRDTGTMVGWESFIRK